MKLVLRIAYLGTNYCGWQVQPGGVSFQQKLRRRLRAICRQCDIVAQPDRRRYARKRFRLSRRKGSPDL